MLLKGDPTMNGIKELAHQTGLLIAFLTSILHHRVGNLENVSSDPGLPLVTGSRRKAPTICSELLIFFVHVLRHYLREPGSRTPTTIHIDERRRSNVMIIRLIEKERYSIMRPASIHQHNCRILETKDKRVRIKLDRTIDTHPPFFTVYDLSVRKPHPPAIKVDGKVNWGFGLTWKKAVTILTSELSATKWSRADAPMLRDALDVSSRSRRDAVQHVTKE
jgi:hypothetical protein